MLPSAGCRFHKACDCFFEEAFLSKVAADKKVAVGGFDGFLAEKVLDVLGVEDIVLDAIELKGITQVGDS